MGALPCKGRVGAEGWWFGASGLGLYGFMVSWLRVYGF